MATPKTGRPTGRPKKAPDAKTKGKSAYLSQATWQGLDRIRPRLEKALGGTWGPDRIFGWLIAQAEQNLAPTPTPASTSRTAAKPAK